MTWRTSAGKVDSHPNNLSNLGSAIANEQLRVCKSLTEPYFVCVVLAPNKEIAYT